MRTRLERNIFVNTKEEPARFYKIEKDEDYESLKTAVVDNNVRFNAHGPNGPNDAVQRIQSGGGGGRHSLFEDPKLADLEHGDYRVQADSPARQRGIEPLNVREMGLLASVPQCFWQYLPNGKKPRSTHEVEFVSVLQTVKGLRAAYTGD